MTHADGRAVVTAGALHPVRIRVESSLEGRNRLTTAFRIILAIPHLILVGGPIAIALGWGASGDDGANYDSSATGGVLGAVGALCAIMAWFAIVFTGRHPQGLWNLTAFYLRWRVRAAAYTALLRDEYPPFGDGPYPATLEVAQLDSARNRLTVAFRIFLVIPHIIAVAFLGVAWALTSVVAWFAILLTGRFPAGLHRFGVGVLQWNIRVEAYLLLLHDEYPPFSFE
jgi:Domain of unknown function (DUF4389)